MFFPNAGIPSAASIFSAYATLNAFLTLVQTIIYQFVPQELRMYLLSVIQRLFNRNPSNLTLIIQEYEGYSHTSNPVYEASKIFLSTKISPSVERLRVSQDPNETEFLFTIEVGEEVIDTFEGVVLKWSLTSFEPKNSKSEGSERRALELSFEKKYKEKVLSSYLPYVRDKAKAIKEESKELKLYTINQTYSRYESKWHSIKLDHPSTFDTLAMDADAKKALMDDLDRFVRRKEFYKRVGKAWKRGYMLYGPPGTGKSSLIAAMANYLKFDVYDLLLTSIVSDSELRAVLTATTNRSILVMEDIDCSAKLQNRDYDLDSSSSDDKQPSLLTLSGLLNFIDGLWSSCGDERIVVFTTNNKDRLDPALLRPGRMDMHIHMSYCTPSVFKQLASNYFSIQDHDPLFEEIKNLIGNVEVTPAVIAEELLKNEDAETAFRSLLQLLLQKKIEMDAMKDKGIKALDQEEDMQEIENEDKPDKSSTKEHVCLPQNGISALDAPGKPFCDPVASGTLTDELDRPVETNEDRQVKRLPHHINDPEFAKTLADALLAVGIKISKDAAPQSEEANQELHTECFSKGDLSGCGTIYSTLSNFPEAKPETLHRTRVILQQLRDQINKGMPIVGVGAGTGISAKFEEAGGADLITVYNSGRFRMAGRGSLAGLLPFADANAVVLDMANEVLPVVKKIPVLAGVCGTDPFREMDNFLRQIESIGFYGVQNYPTVGLFDGNFRRNIEETGMGYNLEVEMIRKAHRMGLLTTPYAFNPDEAVAMAEAGADIIVAHMGLTTSASIGAETAISLDDSVVRVQAIADAARGINPNIIVLCHGGPISSPKDAEFVLKRTKDVHGIYGASSLERLPIEQAITNTVKQYKSISIK